MATRVLLTIDTELTWRGYAESGDWQSALKRSYDPAGAGIPWQLEQLRRHDLKACFFVDPMPALVYGLEPIKRMVDPILSAGQEVQLHLHSFWSDLAAGRQEDARFELTCFDAGEQRDLIEKARELLVAAGAPTPVAFRSGSYAANQDTLDMLSVLGFAYDSSHNGAEHPFPSTLPFAAEMIDPAGHRGLIELPITQIRTRNGGLRPFQICALSAREMIAALRHADREGHPLVNIVSHSFELASRDGRRVNHLIRGRFQRLCTFLAANRANMATSNIRGLDGVVTTARSRPLPARSWREWHRMAEQAWGGARYEHPAVAKAVVAAPSVAALGVLADVAF